jgi:putative ABC transport system ATP-binding protein
MFECIDLSLSYKDGKSNRMVFSDLNFKINVGENVVLLGPSGSGKSSLIYLLSGLRRPTSGKVIYNNKDLQDMDENSLVNIRRNKFGFIFQFHFLIPYLNVIENVLVGAPQVNKTYIDKAMEGLSQLGIEEHVHKKIHELSGGQRQRVAIARAIISEPEVIFADEPTASLDHKNSVEMYRILKSLKSKSIIVLATHDTSILDGSERIINISQ